MRGKLPRVLMAHVVALAMALSLLSRAAVSAPFQNQTDALQDSTATSFTEPRIDDIKDKMDQAFELKRAHFLVGHTSKVQGRVDPVMFDMVVDNTGDGYDKQHGTFTTPFSGVYHFSLSGLRCLGTGVIVWAIHVDQSEEDRCVGGTAHLCTFKRWLQEGTSIKVTQVTGCTTAMTFSGGAFETNYYDLLYEWY